MYLAAPAGKQGNVSRTTLRFPTELGEPLGSKQFGSQSVRSQDTCVTGSAYNRCARKGAVTCVPMRLRVRLLLILLWMRHAYIQTHSIVFAHTCARTRKHVRKRMWAYVHIRMCAHRL